MLLVYIAALLWLVALKGVSVLDEDLFSFHLFGAKDSERSINFIPGPSIVYYLNFRERYTTGLFNVGGNLFLFGPLGALLPLSFDWFSSFTRTCRTGLLLSLGIELFQYMTATGACEADDLLLNAAGTALGFAALRFLYRRKLPL